MRNSRETESCPGAADNERRRKFTKRELYDIVAALTLYKRGGEA